MSNGIKFLMCFCLLSLGIVSAQAVSTVYYVDSASGDDGNSGTSPAEAWASLTPVNNLTLAPGDQVLFKAGTTYTGKLWPIGTGADGNPVIIDMYDTGDLPRIDGEGLVDCALYVHNFEYIEISNLEITNLGPTRETNRYGVWAKAKSYGDVHHVHLKNLFVHDVNADLTKGDEEEGAGIFFSTNGPVKSRFDGLLIEGCHLLRTDRNGISSWTGQNVRPNKYFPSINVVIRNNLIEDCGGDCIKPWGTDGCIIEYNVVNGGRMRATDHAAGIWPFTSDNCVIQYNEVTGMKGTLDGQAFDSDYNCYYTTIQYNYSHDNEGGFMLVCGPQERGGIHGTTGTVIRYNISENDGTNGYRIFHISGGGVQDTYIYNNVIYVGPEQDLAMIKFDTWRGWPDNTQFYNNIFYVDGNVSYIYGDETNTIFDYNVFYGNQSNLPVDDHAIYDDPVLASPGGGENGYKLLSGSPCIDSGVSILDNGGLDYWGNSLYSGDPDRGAHEVP